MQPSRRAQERLRVHFKKYFPTGFIDESDLPEDVTVTVAGVALETLTRPGGDKDEKVVVTFKGAKKKLVLNKTNATRIAKMYGNDTEQWLGKPVTLYFDPTIKFGRETVGGVRVRIKK